MAKKIAVSIDMLGNGVKNLSSPVAASDAATKKYVDELADSLSVRVEKLEESNKEMDAKITSLVTDIQNVSIVASDADQKAQQALDLLNWREINE